MFYKLEYFVKSDQGICADDFKYKEISVLINLTLISSLSSLLKFTKPLSGTFVDNYAVVTMNNGEKYYIKEQEYKNLYIKLLKE